MTAVETLWSEALQIVKQALLPGSSIELEEKLYLVLILLEVDITDENLVEAYRSAVGGEPLQWLIERLNRHKTG